LIGFWEVVDILLNTATFASLCHGGSVPFGVKTYLRKKFAYSDLYLTLEEAGAMGLPIG